MGWMIGAIVLLVGTNIWAWRTARRQRRSAAELAEVIGRYQETDELIREKVYEARGAEWRREAGFYCGIKHEECKPTADLVCDWIDELTFYVTDYRKLWTRYEDRCSCGYSSDDPSVGPR
jgi:hypothetical protein